jgi:ABC-type glycerol-3-phosphate transport system substrate-binding protein
VVFRPGDLPTLAHAGDLMTLRSLGLTSAYMKRNYGSGVLRLASVGDELYAIPIKANSKSLIWYKPNSFRRQHFGIPRSWNQLLAITSDYKAKGLTPWSPCRLRPTRCRTCLRCAASGVRLVAHDRDAAAELARKDEPVSE